MNSIARNSQCLIYGNLVSVANEENSMDVIHPFLEVCASIKEKNHICPNDIKNRLEKLQAVTNINSNLYPEEGTKPDSNNLLLAVVQPLSFFSIYGNHLFDIHNIIKRISYIYDNNEQQTVTAKQVELLHMQQNVAIEYINLLHDILWNKVTKDDIFEILPELDILESELPSNFDAKDLFFIGLWCFVMTDTYSDAINKAKELPFSNLIIRSIAGSLAGLYYGLDEIPEEDRILIDLRMDLTNYIF